MCLLLMAWFSTSKSPPKPLISPVIQTDCLLTAVSLGWRNNSCNRVAAFRKGMSSSFKYNITDLKDDWHLDVPTPIFTTLQSEQSVIRCYKTSLRDVCWSEMFPCCPPYISQNNKWMSFVLIYHIVSTFFICLLTKILLCDQK